MSSNIIIPQLPPFNVDTGVTLPPPAAEATTTTTTAAAAGIGNTTVGGGGVAVPRTLPMPTKSTITGDYYLILRFSIAKEVYRRKIHTIFHQKNRAAAWMTFYSDCLSDTGIMKRFMHLDGKTPAHQVFRRVVNGGLEHDAMMYATRGVNGDEPSELEILSDIIIIERNAAEAKHNEGKDAKKKKATQERNENEAAEVELGLRGAGFAVISPPTISLLGSNPVSLLAGGSATGEICLLLLCNAHHISQLKYPFLLTILFSSPLFSTLDTVFFLSSPPGNPR